MTEEKSSTGIGSLPPHIISSRKRESNFALSLVEKKEKRLFKAPIYVAKKLEDSEKDEIVKPKESNHGIGNIKNQTSGKGNKMEIIREDSSFEDSSSNMEDSTELTTAKKNRENQENEEHKLVNIFLQKKLFDSNFVEHNLGPRFDKKGEIVRHSIVGKVEWFTKFQQSSRPSKVVPPPALRKDLSSSFVSTISALDDSNKLDSMNKDKNSSINSPLRKKSNVQKQPSSSTERKGGAQQNFMKLNKDDVIEEIEKVNERLEQNKTTDNKTLGTLSFSDKMQISKENRIFSRYEDMNKTWENQIKTLAGKINRSPADSIISHTEEGRMKKEMAHTIDLIRTDEERLGRKYWYISLRNYGPDQRSEYQEALRDYKKVFKKSSVDFEKEGLEIIRKPKTAEGSNRAKSMNWIEKNEYYQKIKSQNAKKLAVIRPTSELDIDKLELTGLNKFKSETDNLRKEIRENMFKTFLKPKRKKVIQEGDVKEETYAEDYSHKDKSKTSSGFFPNLSWGSLRV